MGRSLAICQLYDSYYTWTSFPSAGNPHLEFKRLPSYSPQLNEIEHFWKLLRRRATYNRSFERLKDLKDSIRASLCYFQMVKK